MSQVFLLSECGDGIKKFKTRCGKTINLELTADEYTYSIFVKTKGIYRIKIGYKYNYYEEYKNYKNNSPKYIGKKYRTQEKILDHTGEIEILAGQLADFVFDDESDVFTDYEDNQYIMPTDIDIISIDRI